MAIDKTKVASGPATVIFKDGASAIATFTGYDDEFVKVLASRTQKERALEDGSKDRWYTGQEFTVELITSEFDATVMAAFEAAAAGIDSVVINWLNKDKTWTLATDSGSLEMIDGQKLAYRATKSGSATSTIGDHLVITTTP